ncbi:MAG: hypothetical protein M3P06_15310 [Acidobacteriota bacterium]|nr:hypothetical protein [Acidobacteriota bacterium]
MKKKIDVDDDEMPAEFDFSNAIPNPWFVAVHGVKFVRVIDKDLADLFPDNASMNAALRNVAEVAARIPAKPQKVSARRVAAPKATRKKIRA